MRSQENALDLGVVAISSLALVGALHQVFVGLGDAGAAPSRPQAGVVARASNEVRRRHDGTLVWRDVRRGAAVFEADAIYVAADSAAELTFDDGGRLWIDERSLVIIRRREDRALVELVRGGVTGEAGGIAIELEARGTRAELGRAAAATLRLRGESTRVDGLAGSVDVWVAGKREPVARGEQVSVTGGAAARSTFEVELGEPARGGVIPTRERARVAFSWRGGDGADDLFELARDAAFTDRLAEVRGARPGIAEELPPGVYFWRVRRGDEVVSEERALVVVDATPPHVYAPRAGEELYVPSGAPLWVAWTDAADAIGYRVELAAGEDFAAPVATAETKVSAVGLRAPFAEGRHCARVRSTGEGAEWSAPRCFGVITRPRLDAPELHEPSIEDLR